VQITFLGYPGTTGLTAMDFRISDRFVDPPAAPAAGTERVLRLPQSLFCYRPPPEAPQVAPAPMLQTGNVTFGCFNVLAKISDATLASWAGLLAAVPGSRLLLKAQGLSASAAQSRMAARCRSAGIDPGRVDMLDWRTNVREHLQCYSRIDVALDSFPYNGATTTCEALWMGVPVVSRSGETLASRMGASILHAAGRSEWATSDNGSFVAACVALVRDPHRLAAERLSLRGTLAASALMDEVTYVRAFQALLADCLN
jgi:predicted O-linked N-acetylglucosamine transferase (SPINDLY family)